MRGPFYQTTSNHSFQSCLLPPEKFPFFSASILETLGQTRGLFICRIFGDHVTIPPQAHAGREWWREIWPQWAQWAPAHGESWTQSLKSVSFWCQQIRFQASCSFYSHLSAPCRSRPADTLKQKHFSRYNWSLSSLLSTFHFPILFLIFVFFFFLLRFLRAASPSSGRRGT